MKKLLAAAAAVLILLCCYIFLNQESKSEKTTELSEHKGIKIVATLFPQYDFARQIAGNHAEVLLLLPPGAESHTYEPSPSDIMKIEKADVFLYTGKYMEPWAERIIASSENGHIKTADLSCNVKLSGEDEDHDHDEAHSHEEQNSSHHMHGLDPHIWTDPNNAAVMTDNIVQALCEADPANAYDYRKNGESYKKELASLDADFKKAVKSGVRREVVLGGRNAFHYFMERYGLTAYAAHDSCAAESDPSAKKVAFLIDEIREKKIPVIYYEELTAPKVAKLISSETGAKMLPFRSCHNLSKEDFTGNTTYLIMMRENLANLKEGLK